ncbi:hypothetical protein [Bradyrhizobium sp. USDA 3315]
MSLTDSPPCNALTAKKRRHALQAKESRDRKKAGLIKVWITVPRGGAVDFLHDRGLLKEWSLDNASVSEIGDAFSKFIEVSRLLDDGDA